MYKRQIILFIICWSAVCSVFAQSEQMDISINDFNLVAEHQGLYVNAPNTNGTTFLSINKKNQAFHFTKGKAPFVFETDFSGSLVLLKSEKSAWKLYHIAQLEKGGFRIKYIPLWLSLIPPFIAILLALWTKEVIISLFLGLWSGSFIAGGLRIDSVYYSFKSLLKVVDHYAVGALTNAGNLSVIIFSLLIGGMVALITRNGGIAGIVNRLSKYARSARNSQLITWLLGMVIFFDGYANMFIIGNTMRGITDKFKISREKLTYIVDSTTAPVAAVAFISTWIGAELGYIDSGLQALSGYEGNGTAYTFFLQSLKYAFYPFLTLIFIFMLIYWKRDFGAMYKAEFNARAKKTITSAATKTNESTDEILYPIKGIAIKGYRAVVPVVVLIVMTIYGLLDTGLAKLYLEMQTLNIQPASAGWSDVFAQIATMPGQDGTFFLAVGKILGQADSYAAMLWASFCSLIVAAVMTLMAKILSPAETVNTVIKGFKMILPGLLILVFAWALAATIGELHTATFLSSYLEHHLSPQLIPVLVFVLAATIAFATGTSWGVMAILYPIVIPTTWAICQSAGIDLESSQELLTHVISIVLAAAVFGDHCSPISDTTILSSIACGCDHIEHVRTQLPYALTVGGVSLLLCVLSSIMGGGWLLNGILLLIGVGILAGIIRFFGKQIPDAIQV